MKSSDELNKERQKIKTTELKVKIVEMHEITKIMFFNMYKIFKIGAETFAKNVHTTKVNTTDNKSVLLIKMIDIRKKLNVKSIHDLVDKEIKGKLNTNNLTNEQIKKYKRHGSELIIN